METSAKLKITKRSEQNNNMLSPDQIDIYPASVSFEDIQPNQYYQIPVHIRNQGKQIKKIRLIHPTNPNFRIQYNEQQKLLAPGLSLKVSIIFFSTLQDRIQVFEDILTVLGDNFKKVVPLQAYKYQNNLQVPQIVKIGNLKIGKHHRQSIAIKNIGKETLKVNVKLTKDKGLIDLKTQQLFIEPSQKGSIIFQIKSKKIGPVNQSISINGKKVMIKGLFIDQQFDVVDENGQRMVSKDIGQILIGQTVMIPFHIINNSSQIIECMTKTFSKQATENGEIKVDELRKNFINRQNPQKLITLQNKMSTYCENEKFNVEPFTDFQNRLFVHRKPTVEQIQKFRTEIKMQEIKALQNGSIQTPNVKSYYEMLVCKVLGQDKIVKVPIKFAPVIPSITINKLVLDFGKVQTKFEEQQQIQIKNVSERDILINLKSSQHFKIEGKHTIPAKQTQTYTVKFRPIRMGKFAQIVQVSIFEFWEIDIKVFGYCPSMKTSGTFFNIHSPKILANSTLTNKLQSKGLKTLRNNTLSTIKQRLSDKNMIDALDQRLYVTKKNQHVNSIPDLPDPGLKSQFIKSGFSLKTDPNFLKLSSRKASNINKPIVHLSQIIKLSTVLSPQQLANIEVVTQNNKLDFGSIFIKSKVVKQFVIKNHNSKPIMVEIDLIGNEHITNNGNDIRKKIDPFSENKFQISICPHTLGKVVYPFTYIINSQHIFQIEVIAYVTLINLEISNKNLNFTIKDKEKVFEKQEQITVHNMGNITTKFSIKPIEESKYFSITPTEGQLSPMSQMSLNVSYKPIKGNDSGQPRIDNQVFSMKVQGGAQNIIKCTGLINEPKCALKQSQIVYNCLLISSPVSGKFVLKNISKTWTVGCVELVPNTLSEYLTIDTSLWQLGAQQKKQISYNFLCHEVKKVQGYVLIKIRGSQGFKIPFQANIVFPQIQADQKIIDFGSLPLMSSNSQKRIKLKNTTSAEIKLEIIKGAFQEDYLLQINRVKNNENPQISSQKELKNKKQQLYKSNFLSAIIDKNFLNHLENLICLAPGIQTQFLVKFVPKKIKKFQLLLPLKLYGSCKLIQPVHQIIKCNAIEPLIYITPQQINFMNTIVNQNKTFTQQITLTNPHDQQITWSIPKNGVNYVLSKYNGLIPPKSTDTVELFFQARQQGFYEETFKVYLREMKQSYFEIKAIGSIVYPTLTFNCNEAIFPVVPLGVQSKTCVKIYNNGYDTITLCKWKTSSHFQFVDIKVHFDEGRLLSLAKKQLKIYLSFVSMVSISFTTILQLYDEFGNKYQLPISATAENCLFTSYPFLQSDNLHSIIHDPNQNSIKIIGCNQPYMANDFSNQQLQQSCQFIKKWINFELSFSQQSFPNSLLHNDGEGFIRLVNRIANKTIIKKIDFPDKNNRIINLYGLYNEGIRILKAQGAFLNHIRPQYLLSYQDFLSYAKMKNYQGDPQTFNFQKICKSSWIALFYQLVKLFVMPQVSEKTIGKLVKMENISISSVYSQQQVMLLTYMNSFISGEKMYSFGDTSKILEIIQKILEKTFFTSLSQQMSALKISTAVLSPQNFMPIVSNFIFSQLKEFGLSLYLEHGDLFIMSPKQYCLYLISLFTSLIQYNMVHPIKFEASIGEKITKSIQIQNPSNKTIKYKVKVIGCNEFIPEKSEVLLTPKQKSQLNISFQCRASKEEEARIFLIPDKEDITWAIGQALIFHVKTVVVSKITVRKINITACLYEIVPIILDVQLPIEGIENQTSKQFTITLTEHPEPSQLTYPSFFCTQNPCRMLRQGRDRLEIKMVSLIMQKKFCKIKYFSPVYGQFIYQLNVSIEYPPIIKEIKLKQLRVNQNETFDIFLQKENQLLQQALKFLSQQNVKIRKTVPAHNSKFMVVIPDSQYIKPANELVDIDKFETAQGIKISLISSFCKPYKQYSCVVILKNELHRDIRAYRLSTSVCNYPKIINLTFKTNARQEIIQKLPVKVVPCTVEIQNKCQFFRIENMFSEINMPVQLIAVFQPSWILQDEVSIILQNKETLQQLIYKIKLIAVQPAVVDNLVLQGSSIFSRKAVIPINFARNQTLRIVSQIKRHHTFQKTEILPQDNYINVLLQPYKDPQQAIIKLYRPSSQQYYWYSISITNPNITDKGVLTLIQKINSSKQYIFEDIDPTTPNFQYKTEQLSCISYQIKEYKNSKKLAIIFSPHKQIVKTVPIYFLSSGQQIKMNLRLQAESLLPVVLPNIISTNLEVKTTFFNVINSSPISGTYQIDIEGSNCFHTEKIIELKPKQKMHVKLTFSPCYLNQLQKAVLKLTSNQLPNNQYTISGHSQYKSIPQDIIFESIEGSEVTETIPFKNLFPKKQNFKIEMQPAISPFIMLRPNQSRLQLKPKQQTIIQIKNKITKQQYKGIQQARLSIISSDKKVWKYNLKLYTIHSLNDKIYDWKCRCRQSIFESVELPQDFQLSFIDTTPQLMKFLSYSVDENKSNEIKIKFSPMKPFKKQNYSIILVGTVLKYKINCQIQVLDPVFDDTITIKNNNVEQIGCVSFKLTNVVKQSAKFKAYFEHVSPQLQVQPSIGILQPYGRTGTSINLRYCSNIENKRVQNKLIIETEDMYWAFKVRGIISKKI